MTAAFPDDGPEESTVRLITSGRWVRDATATDRAEAARRMLLSGLTRNAVQMRTRLRWEIVAEIAATLPDRTIRRGGLVGALEQSDWSTTPRDAGHAQRRKAAAVVAARGRTPKERAELLAMLGLLDPDLATPKPTE